MKKDKEEEAGGGRKNVRKDDTGAKERYRIIPNKRITSNFDNHIQFNPLHRTQK